MIGYIVGAVNLNGLGIFNASDSDSDPNMARFRTLMLLAVIVVSTHLGLSGSSAQIVSF